MNSNKRSLHQRFRDANSTPGEVFVTAHRGVFLEAGRATLPENSIPAIERARAIGVDMVEIDVHLTVDGSLVVIHDATLDRTTTATGDVHALTQSDIADIKLVHPISRKPYGTAGLPLLEDVFSVLGEQMMVNVELKSGIESLIDVARIASKCGVSERVTVKSNLGDGANFEHVSLLLEKCPYPIDFIPVVVDSRDGYEGFEAACRILKPSCIECVVDYAFGLDDGYNLLARRGMTMDGGVLFSQQSRRLATEMNTRLFVNTLYVDPVTNGNHQWNGGRNCEMGYATPDSVYGFWIAHGATVIQTDNAPFVLNWLRQSGFHA